MVSQTAKLWVGKGYGGGGCALARRPCWLLCTGRRAMSRFDVRTGKVVDGPAERDLRTYRVEVKGDEVIVYE